VICSFNAPLPPEDGHDAGAPVLSIWHVHVIAVTPCANGSLTVTVAAVVPVLLSTVTVYAALSPAFTLAVSVVFVRTKPNATVVYLLTEQVPPGKSLIYDGSLELTQLPVPVGTVTNAKSSTPDE
jgi:hypothetical protein